MDISLCTNDTCPLNYKCLTFTYKSNHPWQSYTNFEYDKEKGCDSFREIKNKKENKK